MSYIIILRQLFKVPLLAPRNLLFLQDLAISNQYQHSSCDCWLPHLRSRQPYKTFYSQWSHLSFLVFSSCILRVFSAASVFDLILTIASDVSFFICSKKPIYNYEFIIYLLTQQSWGRLMALHGVDQCLLSCYLCSYLFVSVWIKY